MTRSLPVPTDAAAEARATLVALLAISITVRLALAFTYEPVVLADTGTYVRLAEQIRDLALEGYNGQRTPVFPLLLLMGGLDPHGAWLIHSLLGVATSVLLFLLALELGAARGPAFLVGLIPTIFVNQLLLEATVAPETATAFLVVLTLFVVLTRTLRRTSLHAAALTGLLIALTALTRPPYIVLAPVLALFLLLAPGALRLRRAAVLLFTAAVPVIAWAWFNAVAVGQFGVTTLMGYNLSNHSGGFIELADERYATIRDIYLRHRERRIAETGLHSMTVFEARKDLLEATGLSEPALAEQFKDLSIDLFKRYPDRYAVSVAKAWVSYWTAPFYWWKPAQVRGLAVIETIKTLWRVEQPVIRLANLALVLLVAWMLFQAAAAAVKGQLALLLNDRAFLGLLLMGTVVLSFSLFQALFEYGENGRYSMPTQSLTIAFVVLYAHRAIQRAKFA